MRCREDTYTIYLRSRATHGVPSGVLCWEAVSSTTAENLFFSHEVRRVLGSHEAAGTRHISRRWGFAWTPHSWEVTKTVF